ncbi:MAG: NAD-dependent epimerase/dehydratase family protein [Bacteriovorax sp.]|jgi:nucleoside-diphosphate-sugar epimerase
MKTILLTGAAGFIGAETTKLLLERGDQVIGVDNLNDYYDVSLKLHRLENLKKFSNFNFLHLDIEDKKAVDELFQKYTIDAVLNLAARAGVRYSMDNPFVYFTTNVNGLLNILEAMKVNGVNKLIQASTSSLYAGLPLPFTESLQVDSPISPYAASKKAAEVLAYTYHHLYKFDVTILRYFTVYGPSGRPDMSILRFIKWIDEGKELQLFGDGTQTRDFTFVTDIAEGTIAALDKINGYDVFNLGGGKKPITMSEIISIIEGLLDKKARIKKLPFHQADMSETQANIERAKLKLKWEPKVGVKEGIEKTVQWYLENHEFCKRLKV